MKGGGTSVLPLHAGIKFDLEQLLKLFKDKGSARFCDFADCFKSMEFGLIFSGRQSHAELFEFSERLLQIAVAFIMPTRKFGRRIAETSSYVLTPICPVAEVDTLLEPIERIFGVYACFALFYLQPRDYFVQIRVTPSQMDEIRLFLENVLIPENHADTVACLLRMTDECAFKITCFPLSYDPVCHKRYDMADVEVDCADEVPPNFDGVKEILEDPLLKQIEMVHKKYEIGKKAMNVYSHANRADVVKDIRNKAECDMKRFEDQELKKGELAPEALSNAQQKVGSRQIKDQAYSSQIKHSRNRRLADPSMADNFNEMVNIMASNTLETQNPPKKRTGRGRKSKQSFEQADTVEPETSGDTVEDITRDLKGSSKPKKGAATPGRKRGRQNSDDFDSMEVATPRAVPKRKGGVKHEMGGNAGMVSIKDEDPEFEALIGKITTAATRKSRIVKRTK